ncbi:hypothetical protein ANOM_007640 [Aspergillus nomiae NRRL 13137]|uniref:Mitochondrial carrier protein pet8 n=1 Tax=Aspergillus nomiae NRRL (strain ATCC 15546 / NRRL 13137 / CBS 260.88 / M93) TaxID=1509407 RepID=A0A0L1IWB4_ASPN3|nr:uncharacterized protein ANOM_007640 [Aspergillus nomiae NRRL 13137]KNG83856.1 hypothetical protein ANOM_007640 [Aspergillus nomiae NRRL 13137]
MSFLTSTIRSTIAPRVALRPSYTVTSAFHTSPLRSGLKESDHNREDLHITYEEHKQEQLRSTKEGKGKWKQELASNSEASVKADRGELDSDGHDLKDLQEKTKHLPNQEGPGSKTQ